MTVYYHIVSLKYDEAREVAALVREGKYGRAIELLRQWDYGCENEHTPLTGTPWGTASKTHKKGCYIMAWNFSLDDTVLLYRSERIAKTEFDRAK